MLCVAWFSRTPKSVTLSTTEATYVALDTVIMRVFCFKSGQAFHVVYGGNACDRG